MQVKVHSPPEAVKVIYSSHTCRVCGDIYMRSCCLLSIVLYLYCMESRLKPIYMMQPDCNETTTRLQPDYITPVCTIIHTLIMPISNMGKIRGPVPI